jgi:adenosylcobinamide kinase/adenosylcobinamide-phosphate guanylyltransferase
VAAAARVPPIILVGGGTRSGKSRFALARAERAGARRVFVATAEALDDEMRVRIARHRRDRDGAFRTVEAPRALREAVEQIEHADAVVIDCLTLWLSNLLCAGMPPEQVEAEVGLLLDTLAVQPFVTVVVANEVGMGVVPDSALGRVFRDVHGRANQQISARAGEVYLATMGNVLRLVPGPVVVVDPE